MTDNEKLSCLIDRPCTACKFHKEEGCSKWSCIFEEKSDVPENTDLISREEALAKVRLNYTDHQNVSAHAIKDILSTIPSAIPEREKGEWIYTDGQHVCSKCNLYNGIESDFCPNCGADMRGGKE